MDHPLVSQQCLERSRARFVSEMQKLATANAGQARFLRHQLAWAETELDLAARRVWDSLDEAEDEMESILREFVDRMRAAASEG